MEPQTVTLTTPFQVLAYERALAMEAEMAAIGATASPGRYVDALEQSAFEHVQALGRAAMADALTRQAAASPQKSAAAALRRRRRVGDAGTS